MNKQHKYNVGLKWTGNKGTGTSGYCAYERSHTISIDGKAEILASSDVAFRGDKTKHNPEDLFVASLAECHMLWYLHLCADAGIVVVDYSDAATGILEEDAINGGRFISVTLNPVVKITDAEMIDKANALHGEAHKKCFIANSVNFPIGHNAKCSV